MIIHPGIDPVAISLGPISIHWYGLMYLCGFAAAIGLAIYRSNKPLWKDWDKDQISDLFYYCAFGLILGGRLGYVLFYKAAYYIQVPWEILYVWQGGMSFHGALIGVIVGMSWYAKKTSRTFWQVADFVAPLIPPGLLFGRIGNFINQELWGRPTDMPWGVVFQTGGDLARHPSQLYEALLEGLVLFFILWFYSQTERYQGRVAGLFLVGYGAARFFVELFRVPDEHLGYLGLGFITMGQILSLPMICFGLWLLLRKKRQHV